MRLNKRQKGILAISIPILVGFLGYILAGYIKGSHIDLQCKGYITASDGTSQFVEGGIFTCSYLKFSHPAFWDFWFLWVLLFVLVVYLELNIAGNGNFEID